jgi:hypothetical protein
MSGKLMGKVYELDLPRAERDVLLAMAENANDDGGNCFPSVDLLAWKLSCSVRKIQYALRDLIKRGAISVIGNRNGGRGKHPEYKIDLSRLPLKGAKTGIAKTPKGCKNEQEKGAKSDSQDSERVQNPTLKGADSDIKGAKTGIAYKEEPSVEPSIEPSVGSARARKPPAVFSLPENFKLSEAMLAYAESLGDEHWTRNEIALETEQFKDHAIAKNSKYANWEAAWRTWMRNAIVKGWGVRKPNGNGSTEQDYVKLFAKYGGKPR